MIQKIKLNKIMFSVNNERFLFEMIFILKCPECEIHSQEMRMFFIERHRYEIISLKISIECKLCI